MTDSLSSPNGATASPPQALPRGAAIDALIDHWARVSPHAPALCDPANRGQFGDEGPRTLSFVEADALIGRLANSFIHNGLAPGDRVVIQLPNVWESPLAIIAAWRAKLVPCVFPLLWRRQEIDAAMALLQPRAVITISTFAGHAYAEVMREAAVEQLSIRFILGIDFSTPDGVSRLTDWLINEDAAPPRALLNAAEAADEPGVITWSTSPLSGAPLLQSAEGLRLLGQAQVDALRHNAQDVMLNPYPFSSLTGLAGFLLPWMMTGCRLVLHQPFDLDVFCGQLSEQKVTFTAIPVPVVESLLGSDRLAQSGQHLSRLGCVWPMALTVRDATEAPEAPLPIFDMHNLENFALFTRPRALDLDPNLLPLGKLRAGDGEDDPVLIETRVKGSVTGGKDAGSHLRGELLLRGITVARPLQNIPEEPEPASKRELVATSIQCTVQEQQKDRFRLSPMPESIYHGGVTVSASELDRLYREYPDFLDVAAFAVDDPVMGQRVIAAVVPHPASSPSLSEFRAFLLAKEVAPYKLPDQLVITK